MIFLRMDLVPCAPFYFSGVPTTQLYFFGARNHHKIKNATMNFHDHCCKKLMFPAGIEPTTSA